MWKCEQWCDHQLLQVDDRLLYEVQELYKTLRSPNLQSSRAWLSIRETHHRKIGTSHQQHGRNTQPDLRLQPTTMQQHERDRPPIRRRGQTIGGGHGFSLHRCQDFGDENDFDIHFDMLDRVYSLLLHVVDRVLHRR